MPDFLVTSAFSRYSSALVAAGFWTIAALLGVAEGSGMIVAEGVGVGAVVRGDRGSVHPPNPMKKSPIALSRTIHEPFIVKPINPK